MPATSAGGRRLTVSAVQARSYAVETDRSVSRKELAQAARDAEKALGLRPALRLVLHELVGVYGEIAINDQLLVWPSNEYLVERTGLSERAVRYALAGLTDLKLVRPKDSANGKRFAIRRGETFVDAFGFDLAPLYVRRGEFVATIAELKRQKERQRRVFDAITVARRACEAAAGELLKLGKDASADEIDRAVVALARRTPRRGFMGDLAGLLEAWTKLQDEAEKLFMESACGGNSSRHIETNNGPLREPCNKGDRENGVAEARPAVSLELLASACPVLVHYGEKPRRFEDVIEIGRFLRPSIGAHESAWREAVELIGPLAAAMTVILVLQKHEDDQAAGTDRIKNPGGYFRAMVRMIAEGRVRLETELVGLLKRR